MITDNNPRNLSNDTILELFGIFSSSADFSILHKSLYEVFDIEYNDELFQISIFSIFNGTRVLNGLSRNSIRSLGGLLTLTINDLFELKGLGEKTVISICKQLSKYRGMDYAQIAENKKQTGAEREKFEENKIYFDKLKDEIININIESLDEIDSFDICVELGVAFENYIDVCLGTAPRGRDILKKRIGLLQVEKSTLDYIGKQYGISRERVRQIIKRVSNKLSAQSYKTKGSYFEAIVKILSSIDCEKLVHVLFVEFIDLYGVDYIKVFLQSLFGKDNSEQILEIYNNYTYNEREKQKRKLSDENKRSRKQKDVEKLKHVLCFPGEKKAYNNTITKKPQLRKINEDNGCRTGEIYLSKAKKVVQYESGIERKVLLFLENNEYVSEINTQCIVIPYEYADKEREYYPDIVIKTVNNEICVLEVKTFFQMPIYQNVLKFRAMHEFCKKNGMGYTIIDERMRSIFDHKISSYNKEFAEILIKECKENGSLNYGQYKKLMSENNSNIKMMELSTLVLQEHLKWSLKPFNLSVE